MDATILIQLDAAGATPPLRCAGWENAAAAVPAQLVVLTDPVASAEVVSASVALYDAINRTLQASGAQRASTYCAGGRISPSRMCSSNQNAQMHRVLVYVSDGTTQLHPNYVAWLTSSTVNPIPVLPAGTNVGQVPPAIMARHVALFYGPRPQDIAALAPKILARVTDELGGRRVFVSYRHAEAAAIASQLFDALTHAGYDVFLDRFRGQPGQDFMERVREELVTKRCVLVLETPQVGQSAYVVGEVATARRYRLGLMAVDLPGSLVLFRDIAVRADLRALRGVAPGNPTALLPQIAVDGVVALVDKHYITEVAKRWLHQRRSIAQAAAAAGLSPHERALGLFEIAGGPVPVSCMAGVLPLQARAFQRLDDMATGVRVLFGPLQAQGRASRDESDWLEQKANIAARDEGRMLRTMQRIRRGQKI